MLRTALAKLFWPPRRTEFTQFLFDTYVWKKKFWQNVGSCLLSPSGQLPETAPDQISDRIRAGSCPKPDFRQIPARIGSPPGLVGRISDRFRPGFGPAPEFGQIPGRIGQSVQESSLV